MLQCPIQSFSFPGPFHIQIPYIDFIIDLFLKYLPSQDPLVLRFWFSFGSKSTQVLKYVPNIDSTINLFWYNFHHTPLFGGAVVWWITQVSKVSTWVHYDPYIISLVDGKLWGTLMHFPGAVATPKLPKFAIFLPTLPTAHSSSEICFCVCINWQIVWFSAQRKTKIFRVIAKVCVIEMLENWPKWL